MYDFLSEKFIIINDKNSNLIAVIIEMSLRLLEITNYWKN